MGLIQQSPFDKVSDMFVGRHMTYVSPASGYDLLNIETQKTQFGLSRLRCAEITGRPRSMIEKAFAYKHTWPFLRILPRIEESHSGWLLRETVRNLHWPASLEDPRIHILAKARFPRKRAMCKYSQDSITIGDDCESV